MFSGCLFVHPFICLFVCYRICAHDIFKTNESIMMQTGTSGPLGNGMKRSTLAVRISTVKVTRGQNRSPKSIFSRFVKNYPTDCNQSWQVHIIVNGTITKHFGHGMLSLTKVISFRGQASQIPVKRDTSDMACYLLQK